MKYITQEPDLIVSSIIIVSYKENEVLLTRPLASSSCRVVEHLTADCEIKGSYLANSCVVQKFYMHNIQMFIIRQSVCHWQALSAYSNTTSLLPLAINCTWLPYTTSYHRLHQATIHSNYLTTINYSYR
jgi:hypothetical protein